jgi:O-antigen/teichoic acid export membrane protein
MTRPRVNTLLCLIALALLPLALFSSVTLGDRTLLPVDNLYQFEPYRSDAAALGVRIVNQQVVPHNELLSDLILQNHAWKSFINESLAARELPVWNPHLFGGVPFLAAGQHSALYPFSLLYVLLPLDRAYGWFLVSQLALAGWLMYGLLRTWHLRRGSALFGGVAWQLSGVLVVGAVHPMIVASAAWIPFIVMCGERIVTRYPGLRGRPASAPWAVLGGLGVAMHVLAGHVEITVYTALVVALFCVWRIATLARGTPSPVRFMASRLGWLALMALAGAAIAAIQLFPLFELVTRNFRGAGRSTLEQVRSYAYPSRYVLMWLFPNLFGSSAGGQTWLDLFNLTQRSAIVAQGTWWGYSAKQYVESAVYAGLGTLVFAAFAVWDALRRTTRSHAAPVWFWVILGVLCVLFMFGTPAYALLYYGLPGVNQLHSPYRWNFPFTVCLVILASIGFNRARENPTTRGLATLSGLVGLVGVGAMGTVLAARLAWGSIEARVASFLQSNELARERFSQPSDFFSYLGGNILLFGLFAVGVALALITLRRKPKLGAALAVLVLSVDLLAAWWHFNPAVDARLLSHTPEAISWLKSQPGSWRVTSYEPDGQPHFKPANANMLWRFGISDIRGYDSIIPKQYADYMRAIEPQGDLLFNRISPIRQPGSLDSPLLDLLGVAYVLTENNIDNPGYALAHESNGLRIYRNTRAMPRAYVVDGGRIVASPIFSEAIQSYDPRRVLIMEACPPDTRCDLSVADARALSIPTDTGAQVTVNKNADIWLDAQVTGAGQWLVLNDSYFPGWRAFVRPVGAADDVEREVPVYRVNGNFRAVPLLTDGLAFAEPTAATQAVTVRFRYFPDTIRFGLFTSFIALAGLLFLGAVYVWRAYAASADSLSGVSRIARNGLVLSATNVIARVIGFAFAIVQARLLGVDGVGAYYFAIVIVGWFEIILNFGLNTYLMREASRDRSHSSAYFFHTTALRMTLAALAAPVMLLVILLGSQVGYFSEQVAQAIAILCVSQVVSSLSTGLTALFYVYERGEIPAAISVVTALSSATVGAILLLAGWGVPGLAVASLIVNVLTFAMLFGLARNALGIRFSVRGDGFKVGTSRAAMLRESAPLMLNHLLASIEFKIDVPILKASAPSTAVYGAQAGSTNPEAVVGWYSTGYRYLDAFNIVPAFFTAALFPAMSRMAAQGAIALTPVFTLAIKLLVSVSFPLAVLCTFLSPLMAGLLGPDFLPHGAIAISIMAWSMVAGWINSVTNYALIAVNQQRTLTWAFAITLTFNLIANLILIPIYSYQAAAAVTIASEIIKGAVFYFFVQRHIASLNWLAILSRPALAAGFMAGVAFVGATIGGAALYLGLALGALVYAGLVIGLRHFTTDERAMLMPLIRRR